MKTLKIETLTMAYNEKHNEIRLLINSFGSKATLLTLNTNNLTDFMEQISRPETHKINVVAQPMKEQSVYTIWLDDAEEGFDEEHNGYIYHLSYDELSEYFDGATFPVSLMLSREDRAMIESELWALGDILDYVMA